MKKLIYLCMAVLCMTFASCEKDEVGGTATEALAGEWYVTADAVDANGNVIEGGEDFLGVGKFLLNTYNTAANVDNQMWIDDNGNFWNFKCRMTSDIKNLTFTTNGEAANAALNKDGSVYDCKINVEGGKVLLGMGKTVQGTATDSIVFYVSFDDDDYPAQYGYAKYKISGHRYSGLTQDD